MSSSIRIKDVVIRYQHGDKLYTLRIPETTRINSIFFDHGEAEAVMECLGAEEAPRQINANGRGWDTVDGLADDVDALEVVDLPFSVPHSKVDLCIHDETCMWFCLQ